MFDMIRNKNECTQLGLAIKEPNSLYMHWEKVIAIE